MNRFDELKRWAWSILVMSALAFAMAGCEGDTGPQGPAGATGADGADGADGLDGTDATAQAAQVESCATCHTGAGDEHQAIYDKYVDASAFEMTFTSFTTVPGAVAGTFDGTLNVTILKNGAPFTDFAGLDETYFAVVDYDGPNQDYSLGRQSLGNATMGAPGNYVLTAAGLTFDPTVSGQVYGYIAQTPLLEHPGGTGGELPAGTHVHLYDDVANAALAFGDAQAGSANEYVSAANVVGCVKCHGTPYLKHGFRDPVVAGLTDFASCKTCHYSGRNGFLASLQYMVDEPFNWATGVPAAVDYTYEGSIMNDTHMAHAMEFPYPQSMQNCDACHAGKITTVLDDSKFTAETCLSCHPVQGVDAWPRTFDANGDEILDSRGRSVPGKYYQANRAPALDYIWFVAGVDNLSAHVRDGSPDCISCHGPRPPAGTGFASQFTAFHTGYDVNITDPGGVRYADQYSVAVDAIGYAPATDLLFIEFSASDPAVVPEVLVSFYGWGSKQFIIASHTRDGSDLCPSSRGDGCRMEYTPETAGGGANPLFSEATTSVLGDWRVTLDMAAYVPTTVLPETIPELIASGVISKVEVTVTPELNLADVGGADLDVVLTAAGATFDLGTSVVVNDYFKGANAVVSTAKCNACHDALASSFHSESGRGGDGIEVCKNCHVTTSPGSHIEMASRAIDSYVHAIHSFQDFDVGDTFEEFDPVFAARYDQHIKHVFPNFTIRNCEACHLDNVYNVPDQSQSMPGVLATSDTVLTWYEIVGGAAVEDPAGRSISGSIPELVTGPASRACGACHRSRLINRDQAGNLASFNAHTDAFGTLAENDAEDTVLYGIIKDIMTLFE